MSTLLNRIRARRRREEADAIAFGRTLRHLEAEDAKETARQKYPHDDELVAVAMLRGWTA